MSQSSDIKGDPRGASALDGSINWLDDLKRKRRAGPSAGHETNEAWGDSTRAIHSGSRDDPQTGAIGTPIYQNTVFALTEDHYRSVEEGYPRDRFIYTRYGNPSQWAVQEKLAALEHAESALVFSSGMAAIASSVLTLMDKGAHVVATKEIYGGAYNFFNQELPSLGMSCTLVDPKDFDAIEAAIQPNTQLLYFEVITNPLLSVLDLPRLVDLARRHRLRIIVDSTLAPPVACRPLEYGVDIVVHSATKYLNGHSDVMAGAALGSRKLIDQIWPRLLNYGSCLDPHACFLLERGLKTLAVRMKAHEENALAVARFLEAHPRVRRVYYPLLESHADHKLARQILNNGSGAVTFDIEGGDEAALKFTQAVSIPKATASLGGVETLVSLPASLSHAGLTSRQRTQMGINPGCVRLSVGIEDSKDLIADLDQALTKIFP
jgi:cystathionine beta-lyase/cystathionine gamma-synthase